MSTELTRKISFKPAFDRRHTDPKKNYGIHCMDMSFWLVGPKGGISFTIYTGWYLPYMGGGSSAMGADVSYHSKVPLYEGQTKLESCQLTGGDCYSDGSGLAAQDLFAQFVAGGEEVVWKKLEEWYTEKLR